MEKTEVFVIHRNTKTPHQTQRHFHVRHRNQFIGYFNLHLFVCIRRGQQNCCQILTADCTAQTGNSPGKAVCNHFHRRTICSVYATQICSELGKAVYQIDDRALPHALHSIQNKTSVSQSHGCGQRPDCCSGVSQHQSGFFNRNYSRCS